MERDQSSFAAPVPALFCLDMGHGDDKTVPFVALPPGWTGKFVDEKRDTPRVVNGHQLAADLAAFVGYFTRFEDERALLCASRQHNNVTAILDYHENAASPEPAKHLLTRQFKLDRAFAAWRAKNARPMTQPEFVEFLEDRLTDISSPSQATLMKSIVNFKAFRTANCSSAVDLSNGDVQLQFTQETKNSKGEAVLPERITIRVPIFEFEAEWQIDARLRYRLGDGGRLTFSFELTSIEDAEDLAFRAAVKVISEAVKRPILLQD